MPDHGRDLGADLFRLYTMAKTNLPDVAAEYGAAAGFVGGADAAAAFTRPAQFGGAQGPAYQPWLELRDTLRSFLADTDENLDETARALLLATDAYAGTDYAAKVEFERLKRESRVP
ncbi:hypothetical protein QEZ54_13515 [Catellatospora sp. KI3]|uniref:hypothetical protein n=1 Tax=Catellatospora sp. KI3 TaxID=3041620 RepID=UPI002482F55E|nr:hypothetical protein [Catellatospora sp. KI3]MDI1461987.1 hypothetical protein [Catellatospora sp. KI3]